MPSFFPPQIGFNPTGAAGIVQISSVVIGRTITGSYEAIGFGAGGRPDYLQTMQINLAQRASNGTLTQKGSITMNVDDLVAIAGLPTSLNLTLREVTVCDSGTTKKMVILGSAPYT